MADEVKNEAPLSRHEIIARIENYLRHRRELMDIWRTRAHDGTAIDQQSKRSIESVASVDIVCRGDPPIHDPNFRQRGLNGDVISNVRDLYDCASTVKATFDNALLGIAKSLKMTSQTWDGYSPESAQTGLTLCALKNSERATDKIKDKYMKIQPGPPESWLYDVVRASFICNTEDQMIAVCEQIQNFPSFEVVRIKNHFLHPFVSGYRDVQLTVRIMVKNKRGHLMYFICEVTVTHVALKDYEVEHKTLQVRQLFASLFRGTHAKQDGILTALIKCHGEVSRALVESTADGENSEKFLSDAIIAFADRELIDIPEDGGEDEVLECWVETLKFLGEYEGAEKVQGKVLKALVNRYDDDSLEVTEGLDELANILRLQGKYQPSVQIYEKSIFVRTRILGERHPLVANSLCAMAKVMYDQKKFAMALPLHEQVLLIRKQVYGNTHADVAMSHVHIAGLMEVQGKIEEAKNNYREAIQVWKDVYGIYHPHLASTINSLATLHEQVGQLHEARTLFSQALQIRTGIFGEYHPSVAGSLNNLAFCLKKLGELDEARPLYEKSLAIRKKQYGDRHPTVATALNNLGLLLKKQRKFDEAKPKYIQALAIRRAVYGNEHVDVAASLNNLALLHDSLQQRSEALKLHEEALYIRHHLLGPDHKLVAETYNNIGLLLKKMGQIPRSKEMLEKALSIRMQLGEDHPDVRATQAAIASLTLSVASDTDKDIAVHLRVYGREHYNLAMSLRFVALKLVGEGFVAQSRPMLEQSLALLKEALRDTDEEVAAGSIYLADVFGSIGKNGLALQLYQEASRILRIVHGSCNMRVISCLVQEGELLSKQCQFETAKTVLHECLTLAQQLYGEEHEEVAKVLNALARVCKADGDYHHAKNVYEKALSMRIKLYGDNHPLVALSLSGIGELMQAMGKYADGIATHTQALHMRIGAYGGDKHRDVALSYLSMGAIYKEQENWIEAKISLEKAVTIFQKLKGAELDPQHAQALHWLAPVLIMTSPTGDIDPAIPVFENALDIRVKKFGRLHEDTAETMHDLAAALSTYPRGSVHERAIAILIFEDALRIRREVYGDENDHPQVMKTLEELVCILVEEGQWGQALEHTLDFLEMRKREFPEENSPILAEAYHDAALVLLRNADLKKAKDCADNALEIAQKTAGEMTETTARMYTLLAEVREAQGKYNKARVLHESALDIRTSLYEGLHENVAISMESIGHMRNQAGKYEKAREMFLQAMDIRKILCDNKPDVHVAYTLCDLYGTFVSQELYADALPIAEEALLMRKEVYQNSLLMIAETMIDLASIHSAMGDHSTAKDYLEDALDVRILETGGFNAMVTEVYILQGRNFAELGLTDNAEEAFSLALRYYMLANGEDDSDEAADIYVELGLLFHSVSRYDEALSYYDLAMQMYIRLGGMETDSVADVLLKIAFSYRKMGEMVDSRARYEQVIAILNNIHGPEHLSVASALASLSALGFYEGRYDNALDLSNQVLAIRKKILGHYHVDVISTMFNTAKIMEKVGKYAEALEMAITVHKWRKINLEQDNFDILQCLVFIASMKRKLGSLEDALSYNDQVIAFLENVTTDDDLDIMERYAFAADIHRARNRFSDAEHLLRTVVNRFAEIRGENDTETAQYMYQLASLLKKLSKYEEADILFKHSCQAQVKAFGADSSVVAATYNAMGVMYVDQDRFDDARHLFEEALAIRIKNFGTEDHLEVAASMNNLAGLYDMLGDFHNAEVMYKKSLTIRCRLCGKTHPAVAQSVNNMGNMYFTMGRFTDAESMFREALRIYQSAFGNEHPATCEVTNNLAACLESLGHFEAALKLFEAGLSVRKGVYGNNHPTVAQSLNNIAGVRYKLGDYNGAITFYERSMDIKKKLYGTDCADVAFTLNNIAVLHMAAGKLTSAVHSQEQAVQLLEKVLGPEHPNTINVKGNLGISYKRMGVQALGDKLVGEALAYLSAHNYPSSHPWVKKFSAEVVKFSSDASGQADDSSINSVSVTSRENTGKFITPERTKRASVTMVAKDGVDIDDVRLDRIDSNSEDSEDDEDEVDVGQVKLDVQREIGFATGGAIINRFGDSSGVGDEGSVGSFRSSRSNTSRGSKSAGKQMSAQKRLEALAATSSSRQTTVKIVDKTNKTRRKSASGSDNSTGGGIRPRRQSAHGGASPSERDDGFSSGAAASGTSEGSNMA